MHKIIYSTIIENIRIYLIWNTRQFNDFFLWALSPSKQYTYKTHKITKIIVSIYIIMILHLQLYEPNQYH